jgi:hypothetical protein
MRFLLFLQVRSDRAMCRVALGAIQAREKRLLLRAIYI